MNTKILLVILVIAVICATAYFVLKVPTEKPRVSGVAGEIEVPKSEVEAPAFEEEPESLDLGSLI
ncbi:MAG: hypothetical protein DRN95_04380 [Candidatus Hydrothermarchaeota archaeon]|nr:MAG: hypothetical protein DRN95_04380 [Candidatus Hydrothermarchaeota archaeon]